MKKILLALMVMAFAVVSASATGVKIDWQIAYGLYDHSSPDVTGGANALLDSYSVTWQLIYAGANNAIDLPDFSLGGGGIADNYVTADDVVWSQRSIAQGGGIAAEDGTGWDNWTLWDGVNGDTVFRNYSWSTAGYVYQRIFESTPAALSWYFDGDLMAYGTGFDTSNEVLSPDYLRSGTGAAGIQPGDHVPAGVPEPVTMSLLGLGALVMAIRRRRS